MKNPSIRLAFEFTKSNSDYFRLQRKGSVRISRAYSCVYLDLNSKAGR